MVSSLSEQVKTCANFIKQAKYVSVLTGAGISTNSGIPDFRGPKGLYITKKYDADRIFDIQSFHRDPKPFYEFASDFLQLEQSLKPTKAHQILAEFEHRGLLQCVITQNIDSLHTKAGTKNVIDLHGNFQKSHCLECWRVFHYAHLVEIVLEKNTYHCECGGIIKPDIVFFGEPVSKLTQSIEAVSKSDLLLIIGSSCVVYPAADLPNHINGRIVFINKTPIKTGYSNLSLSVNADADTFLKHVNTVLSK